MLIGEVCRRHAVMTRDPLVLGAGLSIEDGIARLRARGVRRAPVVDGSGSLIGLVSVMYARGLLRPVGC